MRETSANAATHELTTTDRDLQVAVGLRVPGLGELIDSSLNTGIVGPDQLTQEALMEAPSKIFSPLELKSLLCRMVTPLGLQASDNDMFKGSVFGRDSLLSVLILMETGDDYSWLSDLVLTTMARMRGLKDDARLEEQPGKFAHELRLRDMPGMNLDVYDHYLVPKFGEYAPGVLLIYPTVDATPLALSTAANHVERWGRDMLTRQVGHIDPAVPAKPLGDILRDGLAWMLRTIDASELGLLEYARANPQSHEFHVLEDGKTSYRHEDGRYPNLAGKIAYLTTQGQAHEALLSAARLFPEESETLRDRAARLQTQALKHFWMPERQTFAAALDRDPESGTVRQLKTLSAVQPSILDSTIFNGLEPGDKNMYVQGVLRNLFTPEFLTEAGVRSLALRYDEHTSYWAYQGARSVWPILTHRAARGCRRHGYRALAADLDARMVNGINTAGEARELMYVSPEGSVLYDPAGTRLAGPADEIAAPLFGEALQTWSVASVLAATHWLEQPAEATAFELELLGGGTTALWSQDQLVEAFERRLRARVDTRRGQELEEQLAKTI